MCALVSKEQLEAATKLDFEIDRRHDCRGVEAKTRKGKTQNGRGHARLIGSCRRGMNVLA